MQYRRLEIYKRIGEESADILKAEIRNYYETESRKLKLQTSIENTPRSVTTLIRDNILKSSQLLPETGADLRVKALVEILCNIPSGDYQRLKQTFKNNKILIHIPRKGLGGEVRIVEKDTNCLLYLSPMLENFSYEFVLNTVGHELSHLLLNLDDLGKNGMRRNLVEAEADCLTSEWGY